MAGQPSIQLLIHERDVDVMRGVPALADTVKRYDQMIQDSLEYLPAVETAREQTDDDLEIDDFPAVSRDGDNTGTWVNAWIWVADTETDDDETDTEES